MLKCNNVIHQRVRGELSRQTVFGEFKAKIAPLPRGNPSPDPFRATCILYFKLILSVCMILSPVNIAYCRRYNCYIVRRRPPTYLHCV